MKTAITVFLLSMLSWVSNAQIEKSIPSEIKKVTVYQQGASVTRQGSIDLQKGKTTLLFEGLPLTLDDRSIQAKGDKDLMIVSISQKMDYLNKQTVSDEIVQLEAQKLAIKDSLTLLDGFLKVYQNEQEMILANKSIGGDNGVQISELKNAASFFRNRLMEIEQERKALKKQQFKLNLAFVEVSKQLVELNSKYNVATSLVKVVVSVKTPGRYNLDLKYVVNDAGWEPNYDLRIADVNRPLNLYYKAKVFQNTAEDWENVKLILSTGNPNISNYKPELSTYFLTFNNYYNNSNTALNFPLGKTVTGTITDENGEPLIGATVSIKGTQIGTVTDYNGVYTLGMPAGKNKLVVSYLGYKSHEQYVNSGKVNFSLTQDNVMLESVEITSAGLFDRNGKSFKQKEKKKEIIPLAIEKGTVSTEFEIEIPYSIPSDNQPYDVTMLEHEVDAEYHYATVPKLSDDAFLTAKIPDWEKYEMLSGTANLFFQGIYQGETYLDLVAFEDTLSISIGRDNDILISREIQKDFTKNKVIAANKKKLKSWEITIKNTKDTAIDIIVEDQFPISNDASIKIEQLESSGAEINKQNGKLTWNLNLKPKEKKVLLVKYEVKFPKGRNLLVE